MTAEEFPLRCIKLLGPLNSKINTLSSIPQFAQSPQATSGVSARTVVLWTIAFIVWGVLRQKIGSGPLGDYGLDIFNRVGILEIAEVYLIVQLALGLPADMRLSRLASGAALAAIACLVLLLRYRPTYASGGLEIGLLALSIVYPRLRVVALAVTLFVFQYVFLAGPFLWLHEMVGTLDATVLRNALVESGYSIGGFGPYVFVEGAHFGINVMGSCSSSNVLATVGCGYLILVLGLRGRFVADDVLWGTALVALTIMVNWLRLMPMALSREGHAFWHDGFGASLVALAFGVIVGWAAHMATRRSGGLAA